MPSHNSTPQDVPTKTCTTCGQEKPATAEYFTRYKASKDGFRSQCKVCKKLADDAYREANREKERQRGRKYYDANREKVRARNNNWNKEHRQRMTEYQREWRAENEEEVKEKARIYRQLKHDRYAELTREWREANRERYNAWQRKHRAANRQKSRFMGTYYQRRRKARKQAAEGTHTPEEIQQQYQRQKGCCYYCGEKVGNNYHVDHIVPLSRGGSNDISNLVIACPTCNLRKHDKLPHEWPEGGRLL